MGTFTRATAPLTIVRGRDWSLPMRWQAPSGAAINITGFAITAALRLQSAVLPLNTTNGRLTIIDAAAGSFRLSVSAADLGNVPSGRLSSLAIEIVDAADGVNDFIFDVVGVVP